MSRPLMAVSLGLAGFVTYVVAVVTLADRVAVLGGLAQALYFVVVGTVWVVPARWLILWSVRR